MAHSEIRPNSMYPIKLNQRLLDLDLFSEVEANELLRIAQDTQSTVDCHCHEGTGLSSPPRPLRLTPVRRGTDYHLRRDSSDAESHHEDCRHTRLTLNRLATFGLTDKALRIDDEGAMHINVDFGLADNDTCAKTPTVGQHKHANGRVTETRTRASLLGLLHLMWAKAGLHRFDPRGHEPGHGPFERIRRIARCTYPNGMVSLKEYGIGSALVARAEPRSHQRPKPALQYLQSRPVLLHSGVPRCVRYERNRGPALQHLLWSNHFHLMRHASHSQVHLYAVACSDHRLAHVPNR